MKRDETKDDFFLQKKVSRPSNPPDELAQNVSKKIHFRRIIPPLFCKSEESGRFFIYLHDSKSIFWAQGIKSEWFLGRTVLVCRVAMASAQEVEMLGRQLDELTAQMIDIRQQSSSTAMNAALTGLTEAVRTMGQSLSKPRAEDMRVGNQSRTHLAKTLTTGTSHSTDTRVRSILLFLLC